MQNETHPPAPRAIRTGRQLIFFGFGIAVLLAVAWTIRHALLVLYIGAIFAVVLKPAVERVHRTSLFGWHPGRGAAVLLLAVAVILVLAGIAGFALPQLVSDLSSFFGDFPRRFRQVQHWSRSVPLLRNLDPESLSSRLPAFLGHLVPAVQSIGTALMDTLTVILLTAYLILDGKRLLEALLGMLPPAGRDRLAATLGRAGKRMRGWLAGQGMLMLVLGTSSMATFGLMGLPYFYLLGVFAGIANIIPLLGPILTVVLAGLVAATISVWKVLGVLIFYLVYQQVENAFLTPRIMKSQVQISSAGVVIALLVGGELAGVAGALVAIPSAVLLAELAQEYLSYKPERDALITQGPAAGIPEGSRVIS